MTADEVRGILKGAEGLNNEGFAVLRSICALHSSSSERGVIQELVLRALERRSEFGSSIPILDSLVRELGLFQYLDPGVLSLADQLAYEVHRPENLPEKIVFHTRQAAVYWQLITGQSVMLSAPTSFGKSLIIDAVIATHKYDNVLIIVPTIALVDETRRRLISSFSGEYKVITRSSQQPGPRNIYVATQERIELGDDFPVGIDLFIIDEFYKLSPGRDDDDRCALLNQLFYRLAKRVKQFYLLGPNVLGIASECESRLRFHQFIEDYKTVVSELHDVSGPNNEFERLIDLCRGLTESTIIFCKSPERAAEVARRLTAADIGQTSELCMEAADWVGANFHPGWHFVSSLRNGIGVHHGRVPRALAQFVVRAFNDNDIKFLVCTSTLIEGVNTKAKNIVVFDNRINQTEIDLFTFNNIRGRSGRMGQHYVGHVYLFHPEPQQTLPLVDVPAYSQGVDAPDSLLMQLDESDLTVAARGRLNKYVAQNIVDYQTLKANVGTDPARQLDLARDIAADTSRLHPLLSWSGIPTAAQFNATLELIWGHFRGSVLSRRCVFNERQLAARIWELKGATSLKQLIAARILRGHNSDTAVSNVLDFIRLWAEFHLPRLLRVVDRIQQDVFRRAGLAAGNYTYFASQIQSLFLPAEISGLEEFGIPLDVGRRLSEYLEGGGSLNRTLRALRSLNLDEAGLVGFERRLVANAQEFAE